MLREANYFLGSGEGLMQARHSVPTSTADPLFEAPESPHNGGRLKQDGV